MLAANPSYSLKDIPRMLVQLWGRATYVETVCFVYYVYYTKNIKTFSVLIVVRHDMKFSDLMSQPYCTKTDIVDAKCLRVMLPNTPPEVIEQVYSDHGRNPDFQYQYRNINISKLGWQLIELPAERIAACDFYDGFSNWFNGVCARVNDFHEIGWPCIDNRPNVLEYWERNRTWIEPPVFVQGSLLGLQS